MEEDIQNHSPTVMFRGTPCILQKQIIFNYDSRFYARYILLCYLDIGFNKLSL